MNCFRKGLLLLCSSLSLINAKTSEAPMSFYLECPPNVTVNCDQDISNLDKWGTAYIWENYRKRQAPKPISVIYNTNACGVGTITRTWQVEDHYWKWHTCSQVIVITNGSSPFGVTDITWPLPITLDGCNPDPDPKKLAREYAYPRFNSKKCSQPLYSYRDQRFTVSDGCAKILREWKVIDWCQYKPNVYPAVGIWTYTQVIKLVVSDSTAKIICPRDSVYNANLDCKSTFVKIDSAKSFSQCGTVLKIRNTSPYARSGGPDASGDYPVGMTEFFFIAEYACGKEIKCKVKITVLNKIPPTPYCLNGLIVALMGVDTNKDGVIDEGMVETWASDFNRGSFHACGYKNLMFSFSKDTADKGRVFTCKDLGRNEIEMWVTDANGNQNFCRTYIEVQNNNARIPNCKRDSIKTNPPAGISLSGIVEDNFNQAIGDVNLQLSDLDHLDISARQDVVIIQRTDTIVGSSGQVFYVQRHDTIRTTKYDTIKTIKTFNGQSLANGNYIFRDLVNTHRYTMKLEKKETNLAGINVDDVIALLRHVLGSEKLTDTYRLIAADVNNDLTITIEDFNLLYDVVVGRKTIDQIPLHWKFIPKTQVFSDPLNPFASPWSSSMDFICPDKSMADKNFVAIRVGELDGKRIAGNTMTGRNEKDELESLGWHRVYPNPVINDNLTIDFIQSIAGEIEFALYTMQGKKIWVSQSTFDQGLQQWELKIPRHIAPGIAVYTITGKDVRHQGKLEFVR